MRVDVYAIDMTGMGCEAAVVARPGGDRTVMMLEQSVSLDRADELMTEYLTSQEQAAALVHCSCATPQMHCLGIGTLASGPRPTPHLLHWGALPGAHAV
jgi:hypothetical protein